jgi:hypothetical protein
VYIGFYYPFLIHTNAPAWAGAKSPHCKKQGLLKKTHEKEEVVYNLYSSQNFTGMTKPRNM